MSKITSENQAQARAAERGENCVPAHCSVYRNLIAGFQVGDGAAQLALCWMQGHRARFAEMHGKSTIGPQA